MKKLFLFLSVALLFATWTTYAQNPTLSLVGKSNASLLTDEALIIFDAAATNGFDQNLDAYKKLNLQTDNLPMIYSLTDNGDSLSINALPSLTAADVIVKLNYNVKTSGQYVIKGVPQNFLATTYIYLIDAKNSVTQDLKNNPEYAFNINAGEGADRFTVLFTNKKSLDYYTTNITPKTAIVHFPIYAGATQYTVKFGIVGGTAVKYRKGTTTSITLDYLQANSNYYWQVVALVGGVKQLSPDGSGFVYSEKRYFTTAQSCVMNLQTSQINNTAATFAWDQIAGASYYKVRLEPKGTTDYRWKKATTNSKRIRLMQPGTTYTWGVKAIFTTNQVPYCTFAEFTTTGKKMMSENTVNSLSVYPSPATTQTTLNFDSEVSANYTLNITDMTGRIIKSENISAVEGSNQINIDLTGIAKGMYVLTVNKMNVKLMVE